MTTLPKDKAMDIAIFHDLGGDVKQKGFVLKLVGLHKKYGKLSPDELASHIEECCGLNVVVKKGED